MRLDVRRSHQRKTLLTAINQINATRKEMEDSIIRVMVWFPSSEDLWRDIGEDQPPAV